MRGLTNIAEKFKLQRYILAVIILSGLLYSCSPTKHLQVGDRLYTGAEVKIESDEEIEDKGELKNALEETIYPEPNDKFLWLFRMRLWFHNIAGSVEKEKGFKYWLKYKLGEPPVLLSEVDEDNIEKLMSNRLYNRGHFKPLVSHSVDVKNKKAEITYTARVNPAYRIVSVNYPDDSTTLLHFIHENLRESLLKKNSIYSLENIRKERERLQSVLLKRGYFYFSPDFIYYQADSTVRNRKVNLYFRLKTDIPKKSLLRYKIKNVYLYANYSLEDSLSTSCPDTLVSNEVQYISRADRFREEEITRGVFLKPGEYYSREAHQKTLGRLIGLNVMKFVNVRFKETSSPDSLGRLNAFIYLTPERIHSFTAELKGIAKSNNFAGPGLELSYTNRNLFRGAEFFTLSTHGSWETQIGGQQESLNSYEFGINSRLQYPRLETPFNIDYKKSRFVPRTNIDLGYNFQHRVRYYSAYSLNTAFGYSWQENIRKQHDLTILSIEYYRLGRTTETFNEIISQNAYLRNSFQDQFIIGPRYTWTYNNQMMEDLRHHFFFQARLGTSGAIIGGIMEGLNAIQEENTSTDKLFGVKYAQYAKTMGDARFYQNLDEENQLAYRLALGVGIPFSNSQTLPYSKQFYAGGTNDIRAFRARELGPGSYHPPDTADAGIFIEQTGDIKMVASMEYRFNIIGFLDGGIFVDAGNVWLKNKSEERPGAEFEFNRFYKQIAVGTGLGLRADFSFLIFRLDLAFPVRKPYRQPGDRWVFNEIYGYDGWGRDNLVLNIAIGYPF